MRFPRALLGGAVVLPKFPGSCHAISCRSRTTVGSRGLSFLRALARVLVPLVCWCFGHSHRTGSGGGEGGGCLTAVTLRCFAQVCTERRLTVEIGGDRAAPASGQDGTPRSKSATMCQVFRRFQLSINVEFSAERAGAASRPWRREALPAPPTEPLAGWPEGAGERGVGVPAVTGHLTAMPR